MIVTTNSGEALEDLPLPDAGVASLAGSGEGEAPKESKPGESVESKSKLVDEAKVAELKSGLEKLKSDLGRIPEGEGKLSPDDGQLVANVYEGAQKLLDGVDLARGDKSRPLQGELGDIWWELINVKSQAAKVSQKRAPESLAVRAEDNAAP